MNKETANYFKEVYTNFTWKKASFILGALVLFLVGILLYNLKSDSEVDDYKINDYKEQNKALQDSIFYLRESKEKLIEEAKSFDYNRKLEFENYLQTEAKLFELQKENELLRSRKPKVVIKYKTRYEEIKSMPNDSLNAYVRNRILTSYRKRNFK